MKIVVTKDGDKKYKAKYKTMTYVGIGHGTSIKEALGHLVEVLCKDKLNLGLLGILVVDDQTKDLADTIADYVLVISICNTKKSIAESIREIIKEHEANG